MIKRIVVIGPESTGKTTLCSQLAAHFGTTWVPEYARAFLEENGPQYAYEDLDLIADGQLRTEDQMVENLKASASPGLVFVDTDLYVIKVWSEFVFNRCENRILAEIARRRYDLYLLCNTDLPWVKDSLREYPDLLRRERLYLMYKDAMANQNTPWMEITGNFEKRFSTAVNAVIALIN